MGVHVYAWHRRWVVHRTGSGRAVARFDTSDDAWLAALEIAKREGVTAYRHDGGGRIAESREFVRAE